MPSAFHRVSVRRRPARVLVKAPDTSKYQSCPSRSLATKFTSTPLPMRRSSTISTNPQSSRTARAISLACLPSLTARDWKLSPSRLSVTGTAGRTTRGGAGERFAAAASRARSPATLLSAALTYGFSVS